jgi:hypothetical protein
MMKVVRTWKVNMTQIADHLVNMTLCYLQRLLLSGGIQI